MEKSDLEKLKRYASTTRSPLVFGGCPFIQWDWKLGKPLIGKKDATGRKFVADVPNVMVGFRHLEQGQKPAYALTRLLDPAADEIQRDELGQTDKAQWIDDKDPWVPCTVMPFFDPETRQVFILVAAYGERSEPKALWLPTVARFTFIRPPVLRPGFLRLRSASAIALWALMMRSPDFRITAPSC